MFVHTVVLCVTQAEGYTATSSLHYDADSRDAKRMLDVFEVDSAWIGGSLAGADWAWTEGTYFDFSDWLGSPGGGDRAGIKEDGILDVTWRSN